MACVASKNKYNPKSRLVIHNSRALIERVSIPVEKLGLPKLALRRFVCFHWNIFSPQLMRSPVNTGLYDTGVHMHRSSPYIHWNISCMGRYKRCDRQLTIISMLPAFSLENMRFRSCHEAPTTLTKYITK